MFVGVPLNNINYVRQSFETNLRVNICHHLFFELGGVSQQFTVCVVV